jgi:hypothetical protein
MDPTPASASAVILGIVMTVIAFGLAAAAVILVSRWRDRRVLRRARAAWEAWQAVHPRPPPDDHWRRFQIREQLRLEGQPAYIQASRYREMLAEAQREAQAEALLEVEKLLGEGRRPERKGGADENRLL